MNLANLLDSLADTRYVIEVLRWFTVEHNLELFYKSPVYGDDDDQTQEWRVTRVNGGINDREWTVIGRGDTAFDAMSSAYNYA